MSDAASIRSLQAGFLALLPAIRTHGHIYFRGLQCPHRKEEALAEMVAISWKWYLRLMERGKDPSQFRSALATLAARAVRSGRRLCGQERAKDALSPVAQRRRGFVVGKLPDIETLSDNPLTDALISNTQTPVPDQVSFRQDFPAWRSTRTERDRRLIDELMVGGRTGEVCGDFGLTPARVSQLRREFHDDWRAFCGEPAVV